MLQDHWAITPPHNEWSDLQSIGYMFALYLFACVCETATKEKTLRNLRFQVHIYSPCDDKQMLEIFRGHFVWVALPSFNKVFFNKLWRKERTLVHPRVETKHQSLTIFISATYFKFKMPCFDRDWMGSKHCDIHNTSSLLLIANMQRHSHTQNIKRDSSIDIFTLQSILTTNESLHLYILTLSSFPHPKTL